MVAAAAAAAADSGGGDNKGDAMTMQQSGQVPVYEHWDTVKRAKKKMALVGFGVGVVAMVAALWAGSWWGRTVHISDDYNDGRSLQDTVDCEVLAEAIYQHDLLVLASDRPFTGWAPRAEQNFFRGCTGQGPLGGNGGGGD